jgi:hypothetical protein
VFKKGRGQRDVFSYFFGGITGSGHRWQTRDVVVTNEDTLVWMVPDGNVEKYSDAEIQSKAREVVSLKGCTVTDMATERSLPEAVAYQLGAAADSMRFYTIELHQPDSDTPIVFGFVDKGMIENLQDQIQNSIEHSTWHGNELGAKVSNPTKKKEEAAEVAEASKDKAEEEDANYTRSL